MAATSKPAEFSIRLLISDWLVVDATMDNHVQSAIDGSTDDDIDQVPGWDEGPGWNAEEKIRVSTLPGVAQVGLSIRRAGWEQIPDWPRDLVGFQTWPAPGQKATSTLAGVQWSLVVHALRRWAEVSESLFKIEEADESRAIATTVGDLLAEQGWSTEPS